MSWFGNRTQGNITPVNPVNPGRGGNGRMSYFLYSPQYGTTLPAMGDDGESFVLEADDSAAKYFIPGTAAEQTGAVAGQIFQWINGRWNRRLVSFTTGHASITRALVYAQTRLINRGSGSITITPDDAADTLTFALNSGLLTRINNSVSQADLNNVYEYSDNYGDDLATPAGRGEAVFALRYQDDLWVQDFSPGFNNIAIDRVYFSKWMNRSNSYANRQNSAFLFDNSVDFEELKTNGGTLYFFPQTYPTGSQVGRPNPSAGRVTLTIAPGNPDVVNDIYQFSVTNVAVTGNPRDFNGWYVVSTQLITAVDHDARHLIHIADAFAHEIAIADADNFLTLDGQQWGRTPKSSILLPSQFTADITSDSGNVLLARKSDNTYGLVNQSSLENEISVVTSLPGSPVTGETIYAGGTITGYTPGTVKDTDGTTNVATILSGDILERRSSDWRFTYRNPEIRVMSSLPSGVGAGVQIKSSGSIGVGAGVVKDFDGTTDVRTVQPGDILQRRASDWIYIYRDVATTDEFETGTIVKAASVLDVRRGLRAVQPVGIKWDGRQGSPTNSAIWQYPATRSGTTTGNPFTVDTRGWGFPVGDGDGTDPRGYRNMWELANRTSTGGAGNNNLYWSNREIDWRNAYISFRISHNQGNYGFHVYWGSDINTIANPSSIRQTNRGYIMSFLRPSGDGTRNANDLITGGSTTTPARMNVFLTTAISGSGEGAVVLNPDIVNVNNVNVDVVLRTESGANQTHHVEVDLHETNVTAAANPAKYTIVMNNRFIELWMINPGREFYSRQRAIARWTVSNLELDVVDGQYCGIVGDRFDQVGKEINLYNFFAGALPVTHLDPWLGLDPIAQYANGAANAWGVVPGNPFNV